MKMEGWSRADLERLPDDGNRYEVLDGRLFVTPLPSVPHQLIAARLIALLTPFVDRHRLGSVVGPGAIVFGENELQPDVAVIPIDAARAPEKWEDLPRAILVVEVLSPTTRRRDLHDKRAAYQRLGIPEYWVIDRLERQSVIWRAGSNEPTIVTDVLHWHPRAHIESLRIGLAELIFPASDHRVDS